MKTVRTFGNLKISHEKFKASRDGRIPNTHKMCIEVWKNGFVAARDEGNEESQLLPLTYEHVDGRKFVCQSLTNLLPSIFQIVPADDERYDIIQ